METPVAVLTGATSGIGSIAARRLAGQGYRVVGVGRDESAGRELEASNETVDFCQADLATQSTVRDLADTIREEYDRLDVLVHNAGLTRSDYTETEDGIELTIAVNHLAPYLLTHELYPALQASSPARVVVTSSGIHRRGELKDRTLAEPAGYSELDAYARSKLANVAFTIELADRLPETITANCFHPGFIPETSLFRNSGTPLRQLIWLAQWVPGIGTTPETGAGRLLRLATEPEFGEQTGTYLGGDGIETPDSQARDKEIRQWLWEESARLVAVDPDWP